MRILTLYDKTGAVNSPLTYFSDEKEYIKATQETKNTKGKVTQTAIAPDDISRHYVLLYLGSVIPDKLLGDEEHFMVLMKKNGLPVSRSSILL